jgi:hypothetical protein
MRTSHSTYVILWGFLLTTCHHRAKQDPLPTNAATVDTVMVFQISDDAPSADYPQVADSSRLGPDGSIMPDPSAPPCDVSSLPDTQSWSRVEARLPLAEVRSVSIRLPLGFSRRDTDPDDSTVMEMGGRSGKRTILSDPLRFL